MSAEAAHHPLERREIPALPRPCWRSALHGEVDGRKVFGSIAQSGWRGLCLNELPLHRPWSQLGSFRISPGDWANAWPGIVAGLERDWQRIKSDGSGLVARGVIDVGGRVIRVVAKQPYRQRASHALIDIVRGSRARRAWKRTWELLVRGLPTEVPLLVMEKRSGPLIIDNLALFEFVPGQTIFHSNLAGYSETARSQLFRSVGAILRDLERHGFSHRDAKTTNWIIFSEGLGELCPVMLDCYGVRRWGVAGAGLDRFLRALARHPQFRAQDATCVCNGYAPGGWPETVRRTHTQYTMAAKT